MTIEVLDSLSKAKKSLFKGDVYIYKEVVVHTLEPVMRLLLNCEDEITLNHVWDLLSFTLKKDFITVFHTSLNIHSKCLHIVNNFAALTVRAVLSCDCTSTSAFIASCLHLHLHSKADLNVLHDNSCSVTLRTLLDLSVLCSRASAFGAIHISCDRHVSARSEIQFFQGHPDISFCRRTFLSIVTSSIQSD